MGDVRRAYVFFANLFGEREERAVWLRFCCRFRGRISGVVIDAFGNFREIFGLFFFSVVGVVKIIFFGFGNYCDFFF